MEGIGEGQQFSRLRWTRLRFDVTVGARFVLSIGADSVGRVHILRPDEDCNALDGESSRSVLAVNPGALVWARVRTQGVSMLVGERGSAPHARVRVRYATHTENGAGAATLCLLRDYEPPRRSRLLAPYAYAVPRKSVADMLADATFEEGARARARDRRGIAPADEAHAARARAQARTRCLRVLHRQDSFTGTPKLKRGGWKPNCGFFLWPARVCDEMGSPRRAAGTVAHCRRA